MNSYEAIMANKSLDLNNYMFLTKQTNHCITEICKIFKVFEYVVAVIATIDYLR